jgi:competence protein ComEA
MRDARRTTMPRLLLGALLVAAALGAAAAVDVNRATQAELEQLKGVGPGLAVSILDERTRRGPFRDWADFVARVKGVGERQAGRLTAAGLTVGGRTYPDAGAGR